MAKSAKTSDAGMPPELDARLAELRAQSRSPSREDVAATALSGTVRVSFEDGGCGV